MRPVSTQRKNIFLSFALCILLLLGGCGKVELYSGLTEREANEIIALLLNHGIDSEKEAGKETFMVHVDADSIAQALDLLNAYGLPREQFQDIGKSFEKSGLVSSPTEERIRFMHALSQGLSETLTQIDGVITARVHIVLQDNDPLAEKVYPSSAAIFIKYRPGTNVPSTQNRVRELVTNSIEGLDASKVSIALFEAEVSDLDALKHSVAAARAQESGNTMIVSLIVLLVLLAFGAGGYWYWFIYRPTLKPDASEISQE